MSQPPEQNPIRQMYEDWSTKTPVITRNSMIIIFIVYFLSFFFSLDMAIGNTPYFSIFHFEIYRILFSPLVGNSLITLLLLCLFYPMMGSRMETSLGSASFLVMLCTFSLATNILFDAVCLALYVLGTPTAVFWDCSGFWVILFSLIVIECMQMPEMPRRVFCFPVEVPSKYFPLVLYVLFCLLSGPQLDFAVAMAVGYLYAKGHFAFMTPSTTTIQNMEQNGIFSSLSRSSGWIHSSAALGMEAMFTASGDGGDVESGNNGSGVGGMTMFGGGRGGQANNPPQTQSNPFPGSGRSLSSSSGSSGWGGSFNSLRPSAPSAEVVRGTKEERQAIASRRLAALGIKTDPSSNSEDKSSSSHFIAGTSAPPVERSGESLDANMRTLLDMGFPRDEARSALMSSGNSLEDAITKLST